MAGFNESRSSLDTERNTGVSTSYMPPFSFPLLPLFHGPLSPQAYSGHPSSVGWHQGSLLPPRFRRTTSGTTTTAGNDAVGVNQEPGERGVPCTPVHSQESPAEAATVNWVRGGRALIFDEPSTPTRLGFDNACRTVQPQCGLARLGLHICPRQV